MINLHGELFAWISAFVAILTTAALVGVSLCVCWVYREGFSLPRPGERTRVGLMMHGVFWAFLSDFLNAAFWGLKWVSVLLDEPSFASFVSSYGGFVDPLTKGPGVWAGVCHLIAAGYVCTAVFKREKADDASS